MANWIEKPIDSTALNGGNQYVPLDPVKASDMNDIVEGVLNCQTMVTAINAGPKGVYPTLNALKAALPGGAQGIYVTTDNGHWYYYSGGWQDGDVYQAAGIVAGSIGTVDLANGAVTLDKTNFKSTFEEMQLDTQVLQSKMKVAWEQQYTLFSRVGDLEAIVHDTVAQTVEDDLLNIRDLPTPTSLPVDGTYYPVIAGSYAYVKRLYGKSLVYNQVINPQGFAATMSVNGITFTPHKDTGEVELTLTSAASMGLYYTVNTGIKTQQYAYYLLRGLNGLNTANGTLSMYASGVSGFTLKDTGEGVISYQAYDGTISITIAVMPGLPAGTYHIFPQLINLTAMKIPNVTINSFNAQFGTGYLPYSTGALIHAKVTKMFTKANASASYSSFITFPDEMQSLECYGMGINPTDLNLCNILDLEMGKYIQNIRELTSTFLATCVDYFTPDLPTSTWTFTSTTFNMSHGTLAFLSSDPGIISMTLVSNTLSITFNAEFLEVSDVIDYLDLHPSVTLVKLSTPVITNIYSIIGIVTDWYLRLVSNGVISAECATVSGLPSAPPNALCDLEIKYWKE